MDLAINCAKCGTTPCADGLVEKAPRNCPTRLSQEVIDRATEKVLSSEFFKLSHEAIVQEGTGYERLPHAPNRPCPVKSRLEETIEFARRMDFRRLGVAFCIGVKNEAEMLVSILENRGFEVVSVCCKCGMVHKKQLGIQREQQIDPTDEFAAMCHPIAQAYILNDAQTDFNILLCLCVGHDSLFLKNSTAPCTVLAAKDRLFGHNPLAALYLSKSYHSRILSNETVLSPRESVEQQAHSS